MFPSSEGRLKGDRTMETLYERLKLSSLKDLLESRGRPASNHKKRDIIAELVEMDSPSVRQDT